MHRRTTAAIAIAIAIAVAASLAAPALAADLTIVSTATAMGKTVTSTQYITADKIRTSDGQSDTIIEYSTGKMIHIDHRKKVYFETSLQEMGAQFESLDQMMKSNPMMERMLGNVSDVDVKKTGESRQVAGHTCEQYILTMGQSFTFDICAAPDVEAPISYYDAGKAAYAMMGPMATRFNEMYDAMKEIRGMPLASTVDVKIMGMNISTSSEATEVKEGPVPAGAFDPPAGYKQKKSPFKK